MKINFSHGFVEGPLMDSYKSLGPLMDSYKSLVSFKASFTGPPKSYSDGFAGPPATISYN